MRGQQRPDGMSASLIDPLASDLSYAYATRAVQQLLDRDVAPVSATIAAGAAVTAAAPFIARDLLSHLEAAPWWRRGRTRRRLLAEACRRIAEQGLTS